MRGQYSPAAGLSPAPRAELLGRGGGGAQQGEGHRPAGAGAQDTPPAQRKDFNNLLD